MFEFFVMDSVCVTRVPRESFDTVTNFSEGKSVSSTDLVPGDIYELSDPNLLQFPSDSLLLTGDCIVNESMLTGMSSPHTELQRIN